jgi:hypothetical protein
LPPFGYTYGHDTGPGGRGVGMMMMMMLMIDDGDDDVLLLFWQYVVLRQGYMMRPNACSYSLLIRDIPTDIDRTVADKYLRAVLQVMMMIMVMMMMVMVMMMHHDDAA